MINLSTLEILVRSLLLYLGNIILLSLAKVLKTVFPKGDILLN